MKEVKLQSIDVENLVLLLKTSPTYSGNEAGSHDADINGYHVYLFEGSEIGGGIMHVTKSDGVNA